MTLGEGTDIIIRPRRGWNPDSKTLIGSECAGGNCAGDQPSDILVGDMTLFDTALGLISGDMVLIEIVNPAELRIPINQSLKQIEAIDGRWWLASFDGLNPLLKSKHRVLGPLVCSVHFRCNWERKYRAIHEKVINPPVGYREELLRTMAPALGAFVKFGFDGRTVFREAARV